MKWLAIWTAMIGGVPVNVVDEDGFGRFRTEQDCVEHLNATAPRIVEVLRQHVPPEIQTDLLGDCHLLNRGRPSVGSRR
jgi:hypothetical protein